MVPESPTPPRRQFFRDSVRALLRPLVDYLDDSAAASPARPWLRPPGAIPEAEFLETCQHCGNCVEVCPAKAIRPLQTDDEKLRNTPVIQPDIAACVLCDGLWCMKVCPSGALELVDSPAAIRMGLAVVDHQVCVRSHGEECTICVDRCPVGPQALHVGERGHVEVLQPGCVGCGVCQLYCPTQPKAIVVSPL